MKCNIAFESGGIKGLAYAGALKYLEEKGIIVENASGSSVGALFAALVISGYKSSDIMRGVESLNIDDLIKKNSFILAIKNIGVNNIDNLEKKLDILLKEKGKEYFKDVKTGNDYRLKITVTDYNKKKGLIMPNDYKLLGYNPDEQKISKTVAMSCSVPLFYSIYKHNNNKFLDGGIINKFPINVLNNNIPIIALKISKDSRPINCFKGYTDEQLRMNNIHIVRINTFGIHSLNFKKGLEIRQDLYKSGYIAMKRYYEQYINFLS